MGDIIIPRDCILAFKTEATEGTAPTDTTTDVVIPEIGLTMTGFSRNWVDDNSMTGSLGHLKPHDGGPVEPELTVQLKVHGRSDAGVWEMSQMLEACGLEQSAGTLGTADTSPLTTTSFAFATGAGAAGHLCDVDLTGVGTETRRITSYTTGTATVWPPLSAAPTSGDALYPGYAYLLTSTQSAMKSGSAFLYFPNGQKVVLSGLRGNVVFTATIREPLMAEFTFSGIKAPVVTPGAIGYTPAPIGYGTAYPMVRGIFLKSYIPALVSGTPSTTSIPLTYTDGTTGEYTFYGTDDNQVANLIVDVGSSVYETKPIKSFDYATQTITLAVGDALSGAPSAGANAYIEHQTCLPDTLTFDLGHVFTRLDCAQEDDGWKKALFTELWMIVGSTRYNKFAICAPNIFRQEFELDLGGDFGMTNITAGSYTNSVAGNDELYITLL